MFLGVAGLCSYQDQTVYSLNKVFASTITLKPEFLCNTGIVIVAFALGSSGLAGGSHVATYSCVCIYQSVSPSFKDQCQLTGTVGLYS